MRSLRWAIPGQSTAARCRNGGDPPRSSPRARAAPGLQSVVDRGEAVAFPLPVSWKATLARALFSSRARRALEEARRDLDARSLPEAVAARLRIPIGPRVRSKTMRGVAAAVAGVLQEAGETHPCLVSSLALLGEARRCGYAPSLVIGVRKGESGAASHA